MSAKARFFDISFECDTFDEVLRRVASRPAESVFDYVVTPNVDHVVRIHRTRSDLPEIYDDAWSCLCDSRIVHFLAKTKGLAIPQVTGSGLTASLFQQVLRAGDQVTVIGCSSEVIAAVHDLYPGTTIHHYDPPMGFIRSPAEVNKTVQYVEAHPSRFVFLAVGSPQQEILARRIKENGLSRGLGLCIGSALRFVAEPKLRAPIWTQNLGLEWAYRLMTEPDRLWRRYLVDDMYIFVLYARAWKTGSFHRE